MAFHNVDDIDDALRASQLSARALSEIWRQRQPVVEVSGQKRIVGAGVDARQIAWIQADAGIALRFIRQAYARREYLLVCDAAREILGYWGRQEDGTGIDLLRVRMHFASALTRLGYTQEANCELDNCLRSAPGKSLKAQIFCQLGEAQREEANRAADRATAVQAIEVALEYYRHAREIEPDSLEACVWVAGGTLYVAGEHSSRRDEARSCAAQLLELTEAREKIEGRRFETLRARAEALAVLGKEDEAAAAYQELSSVQGKSIDDLAEARYRARFFADALGKPRDLFKRAFPPLQLIVFSGHLPDLPGQPVRFPDALTGQVQELLQAKLADMDAHIAIASAAAGADLLFLDRLANRPDSRFHIVLPWSETEFRRTSLRPYEPSAAKAIWEPMFEKSIAAASTVRELGEFYAPGDAVGWNYMAEVTAGLAINTARLLRLDLQPLALWDGRPGRGAGGTEDFVRFWRQPLGEEPSIVDMPSTETSTGLRLSHGSVRRAEQSALQQEVKTMLFADIVGYSKLAERVIPEFVSCFLGRVSQLAASSRYAPQSVNTWGDAIYAVFDFAADAGHFALELAQMIDDNKPEWLQKGLYSEVSVHGDHPSVMQPINIRIGLHTGPVFQYYDPVVRRLGYTGAHVSRAARIEPVTKPGEVFASEEFCAFIELDTVARRHQGQPEAVAFICEYAGSMALAKGYPGRYRIYRLVPKLRLDITEKLAMVIHERYCEEERKRGETPASNGMLQPWDKLSEDTRDANREQAADVRKKLRMLGYELTYRGGLKPTELVFDPHLVEEVAKHEHVRWMNERQRNGWIYAEIRDNSRKQHPLLVDWDRLSEAEKNKDRDTVRNLPILIEIADFRVRKIGEVQ